VSLVARDRVWAAAERLRFEPNHLARSLRRGSTLAIGMVVPDVAVAFYASVLKGAQETLTAAGYHVLVVSTERAADRERAAVRTLAAHRVDGLIVATSGGYEDIGVPVVFVDNVPAPAGPGVALCNAEGTALLVDHLAGEHGHRAIAYVGPPPGAADGAPFAHLVGRERLDAFRAAIGRAGLALPPEYERTSDAACSAPVAREIAASLAALEQPPTAIVAGADTLAIGVLQGLRDSGLRVPDDIALASFDEPAYADLLDPPVTSLDRHDTEIGRRAAELLLGALRSNNGAAKLAPVQRIPLTLRRRRSCGCGT